ncbi:MAG: tetratricopeptide repeat protein [Candidatus Gygaella obscura]|nr:tetratricopeptide repeat protein [Candidatus Gygaella obscura]
MIHNPTFILEILSEKSKISMSLYERGSTVHQYEEATISFQEVNNLCKEIIGLLNKANTKGKLATGISSELKKVGQVLYDQLLTNNIKLKLKNTKIENLLILIDEGLVQIPWELLYDGVQFLCLRFNIGRNVKTRQTFRESSQRIIGFPIKMLILADPTSDLQLARQEASIIEKELDKKRKIINVSKKVTNINIQYLKKNLRDYDIVHFAGHADYDFKDVSNSGWRLIDGRFTAKDIISMGTTSPLPSIVFSNSCQSAQTTRWLVDKDFENIIFGLANAFLLAGVRHYIGTFWKIPDDIGLKFAKEFYYQIVLGRSMGNAIREARLKTAKDFGEDTIVWASYVLYGDPSVSFFDSQKPQHWLENKRKKYTKLLSLFVSLLFIVGIFLGVKVFSTKILPPSVAILDFKDLSTNKIDSFITYAITENLNKISSANIIDFSTRLASKDIPLGELASQYRTKRLITGEYIKKGNSLIIKIKLINPITRNIIKAKEIVLNDDIELGENISLVLLDMLKIGLTDKEKSELLRKPTDNPDAYRIFAQTWDLYLKGKYKESLRLCRKVIKIDPEYIAVYKRMGNIYERLGQREEALDSYFTCADLSKKNNDLVNLANAYANIGSVLQILKRSQDAYGYYEKALKISDQAKDDYSRAKIYSLFAGWHAENKEYDKAIELIRESIGINKNKEYIYNHKYYLAADYNQMGIILKEKGEFDEALEYFNKSLEIFKFLGAIRVEKEVIERINSVFKQQQEEYKDTRRRKDVRSTSFNKIDIPQEHSDASIKYIENFLEEDKIFLKVVKICDTASKHQDKEEYFQAIELYKEALELDIDYKEPLLALANIYTSLGKKDLALDYYFKYIKLCKSNQDSFSLISAYFSIGNLYEEMSIDGNDQRNHAMKNYNNARELAKKLNCSYSLAQAYIAIGWWYSDWEMDYKKALEYLLKAEYLLKIITPEFELVEVYNDIGYQYLYMNEYDKASEYFSRNFELLKSLDHKKGLMRYYDNIGGMYYCRANYSEAMETYKKGLEIAEKLESEEDELLFQNAIAQIYEEKGEYINAIDLYSKAIKFYESKKFKSRTTKLIMAAIYSDLGSSYSKIDDYNNAFKNLNISLNFYKDLDDRSGISVCCNSLGVVYFYQNDFDEALRYYNLALKESKLDKEPDNRDYSIYGNIGEVYYKKGDNDKALVFYDKALKYSEQCNDDAYKAWVYQYIGLAYDRKGFKDTALKYLTRAKELIYKLNTEKAREYQEGLKRLKELGK